MMAAGVDEMASQRPQRIHAEAIPLVFGIQEDVEAGMTIVGVVLFVILDSAHDSIVDEDDETDRVVIPEELRHASIELAWPPPASHARIGQDARDVVPVGLAEWTQDDTLAGQRHRCIEPASVTAGAAGRQLTWSAAAAASRLAPAAAAAA